MLNEALDDRLGGFSLRAKLDDTGNLSYPHFAPFVPRDLVITVSDGSTWLCEAVKGKAGLSIKRLLSAEGRVAAWLKKAIGHAGGDPNWRGAYPVTTPLPQWLQRELRVRVRASEGSRLGYQVAGGWP